MTRRKRWISVGVGTAVVAVVGLLIAWFFAAPVAPVTSISERDVVGVWTLHSPEREEMQLTFRSDGSVVSEDWLSELGCPTWLEGLTVERLDWNERATLEGSWLPDLRGSAGDDSQLWVSVPASSCPGPTFVMERNVLNGDLFLLLHIDGFQAEDEVLRFIKQRSE